MSALSATELDAGKRKHVRFCYVDFARMGFPGGGSVVKNLCGFRLWVRRSPGEGNGNPLQYSCLENPMTEEPGGLQSIEL